MSTSSNLGLNCQLTKTATTLLLLGSTLLMSGCYVGEPYTPMEPIILTYEELRQTIEAEEPRPIKENGKIVIYNDYLLINEPEVGLHIFNNATPESPEAISFIEIPGNTDVVVRSDKLYAKSYTDLVVFDISDIQDITFEYRIEDTFRPPYPAGYRGTDRETEIVIDLIPVENGGIGQ